MRVTGQLMGAFLVAAACSGSSTAPPVNPYGSGPAANQVFMQGVAFTPVTRSVTAGTSVQWANQDGVTHTVTSSSVPAGATAISSGNVAGGGTFSVTLSTPGSYLYFCTIHGTATTGMRGTIIVN